MIVGVVVIALALIVAAFAGGYLLAVRHTPRLVARMSDAEIRDLGLMVKARRKVGA